MTAPSAAATGDGPGGYQAAARHLLRDMLLDAALRQLAERSWGEITMADVAAAAGVSRQTLYSEFGSRAQFAQACIAREGERFLDAAQRTIDAHRDDPRAALTYAFADFLTAAGRHPLVRALVAPEGEALLSLVTTRGGPFVAGVAERLAAILAAAWPRLGPRDARALADCLVRLAISHAALPLAPPRRTAVSVAALLAPSLEAMLDGG